MSDTNAGSVELLLDAVSAGAIAKATALIEEGVSPNARDSVGQTPLFVAARDGQAAMVTLLASHGANIDAPTIQGRRPLYWAADGGHLETVRVLLELGAEVDALDPYGQTALVQCAHRLANEVLNVPDKERWQREQSDNPRRHAAVAEALILAGADVNIRPDTSKAGFESASAAEDIRDSGIHRLVGLLAGREQPRPKRSLWSKLF